MVQLPFLVNSQSLQFPATSLSLFTSWEENDALADLWNGWILGVLNKATFKCIRKFTGFLKLDQGKAFATPLIKVQ
jgi:hypothetical protein